MFKALLIFAPPIGSSKNCSLTITNYEYLTDKLDLFLKVCFYCGVCESLEIP